MTRITGKPGCHCGETEVGLSPKERIAPLFASSDSTRIDNTTMIAPLLISLSVASLAVYLRVSSQEEIVKVTAGAIAIIGLLLSLYFAPMWMKALVLAFPLFNSRFNALDFFS